MLAHPHLTRYIAAVMALAVCLCWLAPALTDSASAQTGVSMEYETALFDTDAVISVDIQMDEADWNDMLRNALSEEYYACDVVINGTTFREVAIRPKGNTSLTSIASDPDADRYSFKLEFDHYVDGQTCFGLDKLVLNNNYADATCMKEALIYDMFQWLGADASLYNFARVSVNGEYWGVYLALEAVEDSFLLRNYGVKSGELYKPDGMNMGGGGGGAMPEAPGEMDFSQMQPPEDTEGFSFQAPPGDWDGEERQFPFEEATGEETQDAAKTGEGEETQSKSEVGDGEGTQPSSEAMTGEETQSKPEAADGENAQPSSETITDEETQSKPEAADGENARPSSEAITDEETQHAPEAGDGEGTQLSSESSNGENTRERSGRSFDFPGGNGGFSMSGGANLNYTDDELDSYSTIWDGSVTRTTDADHRRVVNALKDVFAGESLEDCMDVDNLLRYMAVHIFSVNDDSLSGSMAHNYYLYESNGRLNLIPWDYNLAFGGMSGGDADSVINAPIDDAFSATDFFDTLMADETYHSQYYALLQKLVDEYVDGGGLDAFYQRVRSQIDELVQTDPTAFYSYDEYLTAADTLFQVVQLRAQSIRGQLEGTIPSTEAGQRGSDALIDASVLTLSDMGGMNVGGRAPQRSFDGKAAEGTEATQPSDAAKSAAEGTQPSVAAKPAAEAAEPGETAEMTEAEAAQTAPQESGPTENSNANVPEAGTETPASSEKVQDGAAQFSGQRPNADSPEREPTENSETSAFGRSSGDFSRETDGAQETRRENLAEYGASLLFLAAAMLFALRYRRGPR